VKRLLFVISLVAAALAAAHGAAARPSPAERAQQAHARVVLGEIQTLDAHMEHVVQVWDGASIQLAATRKSVRANHVLLRQARRQLAVARLRLERRLVGIYEHGSPTATDVILGATSLSDVVNAADDARAVARLDSQVARAAAVATRRYHRRARALAHAEAQQRTTVAQLAAERSRIESGLTQRQRLLASIKSQIAKLEAQQRAQERRLAIEARARIAREEQQLAAARARARAQAERRVAAPHVQQPVPADAQPQPQPPAEPAPPASTPSPAPPSAGGLPGAHPEAAAIAARYLGVPYVWGGATPAGFDCSGLVAYVYAQIGIALPHYTVAQWNATTPISMSDIQPGDLVFFDGLGHVGIYIGGGQFIHAPHTGDVVRVSSLSGWYAAHLDGARRV
jgi:cell wall-associated NlpC family hydrolase